MNFVQIIATLRKFGNYLAGLFPVLVVVADFFSKQLRNIVANPVIAPWWEKFCNNNTVKALWKIFERFYWRTYSKDRLDLTEAPPATLGLLRPVFQICAFLCILIPLTQYSLWPVDIEAFSGFKGRAPAWSVVLWLFSLPFGWAALLVGTAISNRISFMITAIAAANFLSTCVILLPRSFFNVLLPSAILVALGLCERTLARKSRASKIMSVVNALVAGTAAAIPLIVLTPIRPFLGTFINLPGPVISIGGGALLGAILGLLTLAWARLPAKPERSFLLRGAELSMAAVVWTIVLLLTAYLLSGIGRGNLGQSGSLLISSLALTNSYLWPVWYFIGVGILHKLIGSSKVVSTAIEGMVPRFILTPLLILGLLASVIVAFSERLSLELSLFPGPVTNALLPFFFQVYTLSKPYIWSNPLNVMTVHWLSWVLLFDMAVAAVLTVQKRLNSAALVRLLFLTSLAALLTWEYVFQMSSFTRAPGHSVLALFLFAIWLLWLMHTVGWSLSARSSPCWPSQGRLAVYSGIATIALLDIHARSACQDFKLMNELFLTMFRGVIDVGLPYFFLVWTSRRVENVPLKISSLLGLFSLGALTSFAFNVLEKLAGAGWSFSQLLQITNAQCQQMRTIGSINVDLNVPPIWFLIRAIIYIALLAMLFTVSRKKIGATADGSKAILFILVAFASGIASFSKTLLELPLPPEVRALIAPCSQEVLFNCNLFQSYLAYWIPALLLGVIQLGKKGSARLFFLMTPVAMAAHFLISWLYVENEIFLRASGSLYTIMVLLGGAFVLLVATGLHRLKPESDNVEAIATESPSTLLTPRALVSLVIMIEIVLVPVAIAQSNLKFDDRQIQVFDHKISIPTSWSEQTNSLKDQTNSITTFTRKASSGGVSILQIGTVPSDPAGAQELLKKLFVAASQSKLYPNLTIINIESWNKHCPGALACNFAYELSGNGSNGPTLTIAGLSVLVPRVDGRTEFYTLHTNPTEIAREQSEIAFTIRKLRDSLTK